MFIIIILLCSFYFFCIKFVLHFRNGSIIVDLFLLFNDEESTLPDTETLTNVLLEAASTNMSDLHELGFNSSSIKFTGRNMT